MTYKLLLIVAVVTQTICFGQIANSPTNLSSAIKILDSDCPDSLKLKIKSTPMLGNIKLFSSGLRETATQASPNIFQEKEFPITKTLCFSWHLRIIYLDKTLTKGLF